MNTPALVWSLLMLLATTLLLALPFYPAWAEWRRPRDDGACPLPPDIVKGQTATGQHAPTAVQLAPGAHFEHLQAGRIVLGAGRVPASSLPTETPALTRWQPPVSARPWGLKGWHIGHHLDIPSGQRVPSSLVVRGQLHVHGPGSIEGDIKARDSLRLGPRCHVQGNLFSEGDIHIGPDCQISGLVMAEGRLHLSPGVVIGSPQQPVSVCADVIQADGPVLIHGSVHARIQGDVACAATAPPSHQKPQETA